MRDLTRRDLLAAGGAGLAATVAGCSGTLSGIVSGDSGSDRVVWRRKPEGPTEGLVYDGDGLYALTYWRVRRYAADGTNDWRVLLDDPDDTVCYGGLAVDDSRAYVTGCGGLETFAVDDGSDGWQAERAATMKSPAVADGSVVVSTPGGLSALATSDGTEQWTRELEAEPAPPTVHDGTVYVGRRDGVVAAHDLATGDQLWTRETAGARAEVPTVRDGTVYVGTATPDSDDGRLYALSTEDGRAEWRVSTGQTLSGSRPVLTEAGVYLGTASGELVKHARADGHEEWRFTAEDWLVSQPLVESGRVYAGSNDGNFYAVEAATGDEAWAVDAGYPGAAPVAGDEYVYYAADRIAAYRP